MYPKFKGIHFIIVIIFYRYVKAHNKNLCAFFVSGKTWLTSEYTMKYRFKKVGDFIVY